MKELTEAEIIEALLRGEKFYIGPNSCISNAKVYHSLVSAGFANYNCGQMYKNWKTDWWRPYTPIENRFEILDIR